MTSTTSLVPTTEAPQPSLIKTDVRGRMQRTPEQREKILDEYERSGLSGPKFAALCGVKYQTFATWLARRQSRRQAPPKHQPQRKAATQVRWLEASVQPAAASITVSVTRSTPGWMLTDIIVLRTMTSTSGSDCSSVTAVR